MIDRALRRLGEILVDDERRKHLLHKVRRTVSLLLGVPALLYSTGLLLAPWIFRIIGENNATIAFFLYLPRVLFLFPLFAVIPILLVLQWRLLPLPLTAALVFGIWGMGWELNSAPESSPADPGKTLNVLTYNRGQHMNQSLQPFKEATLPDIIAFQEAPGRAATYTKADGYEEFVFNTDAGEFTLLSRYPIISSILIEIPVGSRSMEPAIRFEIDFAGTPIALYSVHFMSPRDTLAYYRNGAFLYGVIGLPGTPLAERRRRNQQFWDDRIVQARELARVIQAERLPTVLVGDFNAPAGGYIHDIFLDVLKDAHREAGHGFGYSFPGVTRNPLSGGGPWMRIDYLFSDEHWKTRWCITEPDRPSQHRAVAAQFELLPAGAVAP